MIDLEALIDRARGATVDRATAERYIDELDRWARPAPARRLVWPATALAVALAVIAVWFGVRGERPAGVVRVGERVAIVLDPETIYRVVRTGAADTTIAVDRGTVTARLWHDTAPHRLALVGGGITATATGTVYSLAVEDGGATVHVVEGSVEVRTASGVHTVGAGASWPPSARAISPGAGQALLALPVPTRASADASNAASAAAGATLDAGAEPAPEPQAPAGDASPVPPGDSASPPSLRPAPSDAAPRPRAADQLAIKDRWRTARLLRGQGRFAAAVTECLAIADARDPMWSPIALVEAARIELGPLADPDRAIALAERAARDWPADPLAAEARELRCRALRQLGRGECAPMTQP